ncbi:uncharacterized protein [Drosophila kikkawai]|uniref:Uncharacterized protein n=1 Tax=Drosophila kikkawai TaxID=30033 RepID=A0A6P4JEB6_DROKI|nr:uncharacterized protein LOC108082136 [Drosophila kikkawai]
MPLIALALIAFGLTLGQSLPIDEGESAPTVVTGEPAESTAGRVVFDQRQTGRFNIHVSIKDVAIIEVGQNGLAEETYNDEEDYYYDDSALTVKPIKLTTEASTTTSTRATSQSVAPPETTEATTPSPNSSFTSSLLADIAASVTKPKSRLNNLMIVETPIGGVTKAPHLHPHPHPHHPLHGRSKDIPTVAAAAITPPSLPDGIEYTPPKGPNSPIFKVKVQRSSMPAAKKSAAAAARCRGHQVRDAHGKCSDSIYRKLYSMLVGLNFPFLAAANSADSV